MTTSEAIAAVDETAPSDSMQELIFAVFRHDMFRRELTKVPAPRQLGFRRSLRLLFGHGQMFFVAPMLLLFIVAAAAIPANSPANVVAKFVFVIWPSLLSIPFVYQPIRALRFWQRGVPRRAEIIQCYSLAENRERGYVLQEPSSILEYTYNGQVYQQEIMQPSETMAPRMDFSIAQEFHEAAQPTLVFVWPDAPQKILWIDERDRLKDIRRPDYTSGDSASIRTSYSRSRISAALSS